jgi:hypothetical protein
VDPNLIQFEARKRQFEEELALRFAAASLQPDKRRRRGGPARLISRSWAFVAGGRFRDPRRAELERIPMFAALSRQRFDLLVRTADVIDVPADTVLIREGETGREFFAIAEGEVEISSGGAAITEQAGDFFGEFALMYGVPRTATVRTTAPSRLFVLHAQAFRSIVAHSFT